MVVLTEGTCESWDQEQILAASSVCAIHHLWAWGWALATPRVGMKLRSAEEHPRLGAKPEEHSTETNHPI